MARFGRKTGISKTQWPCYIVILEQTRACIFFIIFLINTKKGKKCGNLECKESENGRSDEHLLGPGNLM